MRARDYGNGAWIRRTLRIRTPYFIANLVTLLLLGLAGICLLLQSGRMFEGALVAALLMALMYRPLVHPYITSWHILRKFRSADNTPGIWKFSQAGIICIDNQTHSKLDWSVVSKTIVTRRYVMLQFRTDSFHIFASPMFTTPADWHNFRVAIIRNFIGCRACGYDLHGTTSDTCPECGKTIG